MLGCYINSAAIFFQQNSNFYDKHTKWWHHNDESQMKFHPKTACLLHSDNKTSWIHQYSKRHFDKKQSKMKFEKHIQTAKIDQEQGTPLNENPEIALH